MGTKIWKGKVSSAITSHRPAVQRHTFSEGHLRSAMASTGQTSNHADGILIPLTVCHVDEYLSVTKNCETAQKCLVATARGGRVDNRVAGKARPKTPHVSARRVVFGNQVQVTGRSERVRAGALAGSALPNDHCPARLNWDRDAWMTQDTKKTYLRFLV